jgi:hypothetical protein
MSGWPVGKRGGIVPSWTGAMEQAYVVSAGYRLPSRHPYPVGRANRPYRSRGGLNSSLHPPKQDRIDAYNELD